MTSVGFSKRSSLIVAALLLALAGCASEPPPVSDKVAQYYSNPPSAAAAAPAPAPVAPAVALLNDKARPWTMQVVGDSTGAGPARWVHVLAARMSAKYDRPVELHEWANASNSYSAPTIVGIATGAPIVIWNGSASGKGTQYSLDNWAAMVPTRPDIVVINHGLNMPDAPSAKAGVAAIISRALLQWPKPTAFAITIQSPRLDSGAATEDVVTAMLRQNWAAGPVAEIDVYKAFKETGSVAPLLVSDHLHPSSKGAEIWADTVQNALGL
ncbi:MAG: SGNH/GDSL hydrolase family protein [Acidobacteria bacterium]|nr:SGNH/GDSL hydrolase family protein [Acidobacteriota bacterium]